ncbi:2-hydroxyacid dehydrogenase [Brucella tritici]|uniref:2-hydroxyacid dehydrogenase n=1 Tax=Brucella tritici TaxID=94626 RepID=A0A7X6FR01_9HYPH|nr:2-hydroxyacid dehydrogenase [Brucella tritici]KAB2664228.1 2-hydroxyacid dehydrogenase [Brucella tritici]NKW10372.1 2-hydroxyacid dehydrogenase [Brucella tritici]
MEFEVTNEVLLIEPMMRLIEERLDATYKVLRLYKPEDKAAIDTSLGTIRAVVTGGGTGLSNEWMERLPSLGMIAINGVGTDKVDLTFARDRNIHVSTTPGVLTDDVADTGIALMLAVMRHIVTGDQFVRERKWARREGFPLGVSPKGKRVGVLGLGQIGKSFARRAEAFGMEVHYWNRSPVAGTNWVAHATPVELAQESDVLAVCVAANPSTANIVNADVLAALGGKGYVVNVARGSVVDEDALLAALNNGTIAGAGLDVFVNEPTIKEDFLRAPNTVLMPHQGSATVETRVGMGELVLANLAAYFSGDVPPTKVN